jgi:hypothetical protein
MTQWMKMRRQVAQPSAAAEMRADLLEAPDMPDAASAAIKLFDV